MSYYRPSYSQTVAMARGGRGFSSSRGSSYRGNPGRGGSGGSSWGGGRGGYSSRGGGPGRYNSFSHSFDSRTKYQGSSDKYGGSRSHEEYRKHPYKSDSGGYSGRDHRSPDRKRMRTGSSHDRSFGGSGDYNNRSYESDRRSFSGDRRPPPFVRKEEFRKPPPPPGSPRGGYRGRISSRGSLRARLRERPARRRLVESSYPIRRRVLTGRNSDYARRLKISRLRSSIIRRPKKEDLSDKEEDSENEEEKKTEKVEDKEESDKEEIDEEKKLSPKKSPKKEDATASDKEDAKESGDDEDGKPKHSFIKLTCPHCSTRCATFGKYSMHLQSGRHAAAMRRVALKQKSILSQMRLVQRKAQRELEETTDDLAPRTSWCPLCKLNYKQPKGTHQLSQAHKDMKKFLMPFCKICKITFKSPMIYESHCCSIEHIKRRALLNGDKSDQDMSGNEDDPMENFMTIDSVGDMDEEAEPVEKKEGEVKSKEQINVGIENIRKVEVHYCDLCRMYLPRVNEDEEMHRILARHCKQRTHLQKYIRYKEDKELAKRAERLQRKETAEKEKEKDKEEVKDTDVKDEEKKEPKPKSDPATSNEDEKMWADVDKDLGDILAEAGSCHKSSDEDEEDSIANGERYDRFKYSEKNEELKKKKKEEKEAEEKKLEDDAEAEK